LEFPVAHQVSDHYSISAWRDYDQAAVAFRDGMSMGSWPLTASSGVSADDLFAAGARQVAVHEVIELDSADARGVVQALALVRDLTACGVVVDWSLRIGAAARDWRELSHLYPPASVALDGADDAATRDAWASSYVITKLAARRGPGMLQIRDRRWGGLRNVTITSPEYLTAVARLEHGAPAEEIPARILSKLQSTQLVGVVGELAWWLPYRVRRWAVSFRIV
jgi:uncharacterized protein DUF5825